MATGHLFMTKKEINNDIENYYKLSIQVSLNGLSFCIVDTIANTINEFKRRSFGNELSPYELQKELKQLFRESNIEGSSFSEVVVIHKNNLFLINGRFFYKRYQLGNVVLLIVTGYDNRELHDLSDAPFL